MKKSYIKPCATAVSLYTCEMLALSLTSEKANGNRRALKNLSNSKPNNKNSGAATPLCCDPAFIRNFRKYLKNSPNNASQTYIWLHLTAFRVFLRHFRLICLHS